MTLLRDIESMFCMLHVLSTYSTVLPSKNLQIYPAFGEVVETFHKPDTTTTTI